MRANLLPISFKYKVSTRLLIGNSREPMLSQNYLKALTGTEKELKNHQMVFLAISLHLRYSMDLHPKNSGLARTDLQLSQ
jgi:hypothetical protein